MLYIFIMWSLLLQFSVNHAKVVLIGIYCLFENGMGLLFYQEDTITISIFFLNYEQVDQLKSSISWSFWWCSLQSQAGSPIIWFAMGGTCTLWPWWCSKHCSSPCSSHASWIQVLHNQFINVAICWSPSNVAAIYKPFVKHLVISSEAGSDDWTCSPTPFLHYGEIYLLFLWSDEQQEHGAKTWTKAWKNLLWMWKLDCH